MGRSVPAGNLGHEPVRLQAGSLELLLCNSALRKIRHGKTEIIRAIYAAVRDQDWGTVPFLLDSFDFEQTPDSFRIKMNGRFGEDEIFGEAEILIAGKPPANLEFCFQFTASSSFLKNRIGICVLLPIEECKGRSYTQVQSDGQEIRDRFPVFIAPNQPLLDIRFLEWEAPDHLRPRLVFDGDLFEMEDQRNWTDASFKIYSTPLSQPFPVKVAGGELFSQQVRLNLVNQVVIPDGQDNSVFVEIKLAGKIGNVPSLGICLGQDYELHHRKIRNAFNDLPLTHLRADILLSHPYAVERTMWALSIAKGLNCSLELVLLTTEGDSLPNDMIVLLKAFQLRLARIMVYSDMNFVSNGDAELRLLSLLRDNLRDVSIGGGSNANFAELNRNRISSKVVDFIAVAANPQVHATDDLSLVENLEGLLYLMESMENLYPGEPAVISPLSLKPRFNAVATSESKTMDETPEKKDPRFNQAFGALWTLCALKKLSQCGTESVTIDEIPADSSPLYKALGFISGSPGDWQILDTVSTRPGETEALIFANNTEILVMVLNFSDKPESVKLPTFSGLPELIEITDMASVNHGSVSPGILSFHKRGIYILRYLTR
jgi:hypothetical protein